MENEIVLYRPDETVQLEVRLQDETVWLTQQQMADLFGTQRQAITKHLKNIFDSKELDKKATCSILELVQREGNRMVRRSLEIYNLDVIISVGYRVNTIRGIQFRQWASRILKDYMLRGYAVNQRLERLEQRVSKTEEQIEFFVHTSLPPKEGIFVDGQIYDAFDFVKGLISGAKESITLIDNYADESVLTMMTDKQKGVSVDIYTLAVGKALQQAVENFNKQYGNLTMHAVKSIHDRFLIIDDKEIYLIGASLKDLGRKLFAFSKMEPQQIDVLRRYLLSR